ncbi:MAG: thioredoxin family protein, partial [Desulfotignum sp.]
MEIKILGPGSPKCEQTGKIVAEAVSETGLKATVEKVTGVMDIAG